jgi:hypothetical protein
MHSPSCCWATPSTPPEPNGGVQTISVIHPFHPWFGRTFEFVSVRHTWKQHRAFFLLDDGTLTSVPTGWTDMAEPDVFVVAAAGRSHFRPRDLLEVAEVIDGCSRWQAPDVV